MIATLFGDARTPSAMAEAVVMSDIGRVLLALSREAWETYRSTEGELLFDAAARVAAAQRERARVRPSA